MQDDLLPRTVDFTYFWHLIGNIVKTSLLVPLCPWLTQLVKVAIYLWLVVCIVLVYFIVKDDLLQRTLDLAKFWHHIRGIAKTGLLVPQCPCYTQLVMVAKYFPHQIDFNYSVHKQNLFFFSWLLGLSWPAPGNPSCFRHNWYV